MKYAKLTLKCNYDFVREINELMTAYDGYVLDFFKEVKMAAFDALEKASRRNEPECNISAEVTITCPYCIWEIANDLLISIPKGCTDVYYMLEQIVAIPERKFKA